MNTIQHSDGKPFDLAVIGGGPGGYVAAIRAAQLGLKVVVLEKADLGGICANWGCIPTKALLHTAEIMAAMRHGADLGIACDNLRVDFGKVIARSRAVAETQKKGVAYLLKKNKIEHIKGRGTLSPPVQAGGRPRLFANGQEVAAENILLATGARPRALPGIEPDGDRILTYFEAMSLKVQPTALTIIGAGAIGVEFAYFYNAIGTKVVLIEAMGQILPVEDDEIAAQVERSLRKQGITVVTGAKVSEVARGASEVRVRYSAPGAANPKEEIVTSERVLLSVGVRGNTEDLGLAELGARVERGFLQVDEAYRVQGNGGVVSGLYAIGDVIGGAMLAHKASAEGIACVERIAGVPEGEIRKVNYSAIPGATFCRPEVASMGLTEKKARETGREIKVGRFPFKASGKAQATSETEGMVKVILDAKSGEILGSHIVGGSASDMIATLTLARSAELTDTEILHTVFAHPTYAEIMKGAVEAAHGEAIDL